MSNIEKFNKEELENLRLELTHHHEKWKEYRNLVNLVSEHEDRQSSIDGNTVSHDEETISKLRDEMNMRQKEVDKSYRHLKVKVFQGSSDDEFKDARVKDLWKRANVQGLSAEELNILKVGNF